MGRQINVELHALQAICHLDYSKEVIEVPRETWSGQDAYEDVTLHFVRVRTPDWQTITLSVYGCYGTVDCRGPGSPAFWFEEWLTQNGVAFLEG